MPARHHYRSVVAGRFAVEPGDVLVHGSYDCHANQALTRRGPQLLRLPWFDDELDGHFRVADPDRFARMAARSARRRGCAEAGPPADRLASAAPGHAGRADSGTGDAPA
jgi:hypothetical protein